MKDYRILTVKQPWAELIASGRKPIETRSWPTRWRGIVLIHAAATTSRGSRKAYGELCSSLGLGVNLPLGQVVAIARLVDCEPYEPRHEVLSCCPWRPDAHAWILDDIQRLPTPFPAKGALGLRRATLAQVQAVEPLISRPATEGPNGQAAIPA